MPRPRKPKVGRPRGVNPRTVSRTVKLTPGEAAAQDTTAGETPWATWAHDTLVAATASDD